MTDKERLYVAEIARCGSITRAAESLFISQPSLSQALQRIEQEYGAEFFIRSRDAMQLTDFGKAYLEAADRIEKRYQRLKEDICSVSGMTGGKLDIGITAVQGGVILPNLIRLCRQRYPLLELRIVEETSAQLEKLAHEERLNLVIIHTPFRDYKLDYISLYREDFCLAVSPDDPDYAEASRKDPLPLLTQEILKRQKFNMLSAHQRCRQMADRILTAAGVIPRMHFTTSNLMTALSLTQAGLGATFIPVSFLRHFSSAYRLAAFRIPAEWGGNWELAAAYANAATLTPSGMALIRLIKDEIINGEGQL